MIKLNYFQDSGHGWIEIPKNLSFGLKFSQFSYEQKNFYYVEEDYDFYRWNQKAQENNVKYELIEIYDDGSSLIRKYPRCKI